MHQSHWISFLTITYLLCNIAEIQALPCARNNIADRQDALRPQSTVENLLLWPNTSRFDHSSKFRGSLCVLVADCLRCNGQTSQQQPRLTLLLSLYTLSSSRNGLSAWPFLNLCAWLEFFIYYWLSYASSMHPAIIGWRLPQDNLAQCWVLQWVDCWSMFWYGRNLCGKWRKHSVTSVVQQVAMTWTSSFPSKEMVRQA